MLYCDMQEPTSFSVMEYWIWSTSCRFYFNKIIVDSSIEMGLAHLSKKDYYLQPALAKNKNHTSLPES